MRRFSILVLASALLAACQQTAPILNPPPGGHDALSRPPASLMPAPS